jgi:hypothetical protein
VGKVIRMRLLGTVALLGAAMIFAGCKSAPELSAANAQALIQAKYDADPAVSTNIVVDDLGMREGVTAKYWDRSKAYPNKYWADFKLSEDGKKSVKLPSGTDIIEWRPASMDDKTFSVIVSTVATNHLKAHDVADPQDEVGGTKSATFNEVKSLDGVPAPLQGIAHNPGNHLSSKKTATFSLDNGAWKLQSIN